VESNSVKVSAAQAKDALENLHHARQLASQARRPPAWYVVCFGALVGLLTLAYAQMRHENLWALGLGAAFTLLIVLAIVHYYRFRLAGIRLKQHPGGLAGHASSLVYTVLLISIMAGSREASLQGMTWAVYLGASANAGMTWALGLWMAKLP
jgi:hypothetical protein